MTYLSRKIRFSISPTLLAICLIFCSPCLVPQLWAQSPDKDPGEYQDLPIPAEQLEHILATTEKNLSRIKTLKTRLIQEKNISLFSEPVLSTGILLFKTPGDIRLEFFEPFKSILLVSGDTISKFEEFNGKWNRMNSGNEKIMGIILDHIAGWVNGRFNQGNMYKISGQYRSAPLPKGQQKFTLILEPRAKEFKQFIQAFELGISSGMDRLDYIIIRESGKDYTKIDFHEDRINTPIDDVYFDGNQLPPILVPQWASR